MHFMYLCVVHVFCVDVKIENTLSFTPFNCTRSFELFVKVPYFLKKTDLNRLI